MTLLITFLTSFSGVLLAIGAIWVAVHQTRKKNKFSPFTEKLLRSPGYSLGQQLDNLKIDMLEAYLGVGLFPAILVILSPFLPLSVTLALASILFPLMAISLKKLTRLFSHSQVLRLGLDGEVYTGQELNLLMRQGAWVFHDIPYKYGNIDHVVVSCGGVFVVETKAVRKPSDQDGRRQSKVSFAEGKLRFPHHTTQAPIQQAKRHAEYVASFLKKKTGKPYPVTPVVALPGWYVMSPPNADCLVINPKRGGGLRSFVQKRIIDPSETEVIANHIEEFSRTVESRSDINDPDARTRYDFFLNRKHETDTM